MKLIADSADDRLASVVVFNMDLLDQVAAFIEAEHLFAKDNKVAVGVSGGVDSVVLLDALDRLGYSQHVVHVNFGIRAESDADSAFVADLAAAYGAPLTLVSAPLDTGAAGSIQEAARCARYAAFEDVATQYGIDHVAVAHHRNDQAETVLMNLFRGTGIEGLAGMPPVRPISKTSSVNVVRPLLAVTRKQVVEYATATGLKWREDVTNNRIDYKRNFVRNNILPIVEQAFGTGVSDRVSATAGLVREFVATNLGQDDDLFALSTDANRKSILLDPFLKLPVAWQGKIIADALRLWTSEQYVDGRTIEAIRKLGQSQTGKRYATRRVTVVRDRGRLEFATPRDDDAILPAVLKVGQGVSIARRRITLLEVTAPPADALLTMLPEGVEVVDLEQLRSPIRIRQWREGDKFQPLGMKTDKRVSDFLTDLKVGHAQRDQELVLESENRVIGVVGRRIAESVKISKSTRRAGLLIVSPI